MGSLDAYIHYENLILLKKQLADPRTTDKQRQILQKLLTEEEGEKLPRDDGRAAAEKSAT